MRRFIYLYLAAMFGLVVLTVAIFGVVLLFLSPPDQGTSAGDGLTTSHGVEDGASVATAKKKPVPVEVMEVNPETFDEFGAFYGTVRGTQQVTLMAFGGGRVQSIAVQEGEAIKAGDQLCDIEAERFQVLRESAIVARKMAWDSLKRFQMHVQRGSGSQMQLDEANRNFLNARAQVIDAEQNLEAARCIAPIDGVVVERLIEPHEYLQPGSPTLVIAQLEQVKIDAGIPENEIAGYEVGNAATITLSSAPGLTWTGRISRLAQRVDRQTRSFAAEILVDNDPQLTLKPGLTAKARVLRNSYRDAVVIPTASIITLAKDRVVMVADGDVARRKVVKVRASDDHLAVIDEGLAVGDRLIVGGHYQVSDASPIKVVQP